VTHRIRVIVRSVVPDTARRGARLVQSTVRRETTKPKGNDGSTMTYGSFTIALAGDACARCWPVRVTCSASA
jgi:hypothetical protein